MQANFSPQPKKRRLGVHAALASILFFGLLLGLGFYGAKQRDKAEAAENAQRAFEATPEGKEAQAEQKKAEREAKDAKFLRAYFARECGDNFLRHGLDIQCLSAEDEKEPTLWLTGPTVDRVFAYNFVTRKTSKALRKLGFTTVTFSNSKSDDYFIESYALMP